MILGTKENLLTYKGISDNLDKAIDFIMNMDESIEDGKYLIDGDEVYANVMTGTLNDSAEINYEAHKKYGDLQFILEGGEIFYYAPVSRCTAATEYNEQKDVYMLKGDGEKINAAPKDFYILFSEDAHAPSRGEKKSGFRKAVVKFKI